MRLNSRQPTMIRSTMIIIIIGAFVLMASTANDGDPTNNLTGSTGLHDPSSVIKCGDKYYVYSTGGGAKSSTDRKNWSNGTSVINGTNGIGTQSWWSAHGGSIWAPEVANVDGVYYCYYSVSAWGNYNSAIGVATNTTLNPSDANYKWVDKGIVIDSTQAANGGGVVNVIDPGTFQDDDGKFYMQFGSYRNGCRMIELNRSTGKAATNPPNPIKMTNSLGEASFIIHWKTYYYYVVSRGSCCDGMNSTYQIVYGRGTSVKGPYTTKPTTSYPNGQSFQSNYYTVLLTRDSLNGAILHAGMGGQAFFWDHDSLFIDYHAYTAPSGNSYLNIKPVYADAQDWLTLDPTKGTIITRPTSLTPGMLVRGSSILTNNPVAVRLMGAVNSASRKPLGQLYSIIGRRITAKTIQGIPAGIFIEKRTTESGR